MKSARQQVAGPLKDFFLPMAASASRVLEF